jgi:hypothetical protein
MCGFNIDLSQYLVPSGDKILFDRTFQALSSLNFNVSSSQFLVKIISSSQKTKVLYNELFAAAFLSAETFLLFASSDLLISFTPFRSLNVSTSPHKIISYFIK